MPELFAAFVGALGALLAVLTTFRMILRERSRAHGDGELPLSIDLVDEPLRSGTEDLLGRSSLAKLVAEEVRNQPRGSSTVFALTGPWGSGKSSLLNMIAEHLECVDSTRITVVFNPWLFSGTEQLLQRFFAEVSEHLRVKLPGNRLRIADQLEAYGGAVAGIGGLSPIALVVKSVVSFGRAHLDDSVEAQRRAVADSLTKLEHPVLIIIDDIDRLQPQEVVDILRLVRLVAHLPNVSYMLAFDEVRVASLLVEQGVGGRAYLEKIVQRRIDVPLPTRSAVMDFTLASLNRQLSDDWYCEFAEDDWPDIAAEIILPLIKTLRDAKKFVAAASSTVHHIGRDVNLADLLAVETLRLFLPDAYSTILLQGDAFTSHRRPGGEEVHDRTIQEFLEVDPANRDVLEAVCRRLFPVTRSVLGGATYGPEWLKTWRRSQRIAHPDVLRYIAERSPSSAVLAARATRTVAELMLNGDRLGMERVLSELDKSIVADAVAGLEDYEDQFTPIAARAAVPVLTKLYGALKERGTGLFEVPAELLLSRVVLRLLRAVDPRDRSGIVEASIRTGPLFGAYELVSLVGSREGVGAELLDPVDAAKFERLLMRAIVGERREELKSGHALEMLSWVVRFGDQSHREAVRQLLYDDDIVATVLLDSVGFIRSQGVGSRRVRRSPRLAWDSLVDVFGSEDAIAAAAQRLGSRPEDAERQEVINLVTRYLEGWRPERA